jgi:hypothetical protein
MTSGTFWQSLQPFDYAKTYSLLRGEDGGRYYEYAQQQARIETDPRLKQAWIDRSTRGSVSSLITNGIFHPTAVQTHLLKADSAEMGQLGEILNIPYIDHIPWMCAPIYRDAIIFYRGEKVVAYLGICLSCDSIESDHQKRVDTDSKAFPKWKSFIESLGHTVEE